MQKLAIILLAYGCGSIPFGKIIAGLYGVDIQKRGSGNIGFSNVRRVLGWHASIPVLLLDILKGAGPTLLALCIFGESFAFIVGITAVVGHIVPVWLRFKGGKGIATGLGVVLAITPLVGVIAFAVYLLTCAVVRTSSFGSLAGSCTVMLVGSVLYPRLLWAYGLLLCISLITLRKNLNGTVANYDA